MLLINIFMCRKKLLEFVPTLKYFQYNITTMFHAPVQQHGVQQDFVR